MNKYEKALNEFTIGVKPRTNHKILKELVERATPIVFINECDCIVDFDLLQNAIRYICDKKNKKIKKEYRIFKINKYPMITIAHEKYRLHQLLGMYVYKEDYIGKVIHHKDFDTLNNKMSNLVLMTNSAHSKLHTKNKKIPEEIRIKGIKKAVEINKRHDITIDKILVMKSFGKSIKEIATELDCSENTIYRRLGMKS